MKFFGYTTPNSRGNQRRRRKTVELRILRKFYRKNQYLMVKTMVSCKFSLKPIHWIFFCERWWNMSTHISIDGQDSGPNHWGTSPREIFHHGLSMIRIPHTIIHLRTFSTFIYIYQLYKCMFIYVYTYIHIYCMYKCTYMYIIMSNMYKIKSK